MMGVRQWFLSAEVRDSVRAGLSNIVEELSAHQKCLGAALECHKEARSLTNKEHRLHENEEAICTQLSTKLGLLLEDGRHPPREMNQPNLCFIGEGEENEEKSKALISVETNIQDK
ncbi:hypothetical protein ACA910_006380 [Epithemia clementina (nom. ined.)]